MAFPASPTESGGAKLHFLTTDGNAAGGWFSVYNANTTTGTNAVGFAAVATHISGDPVAEPGGLPTGSIPLLLMGGDDGTNVMPLQVDASDFLKVVLQANSGVDIGDVDVLSLPALATGTNAIGKLAANSGVDIGDVDVLSVIPGTGASNLGKAEDAVHTSGDVGVMMLGVENADQAALTAGDKDYTPIAVTAEGNVLVEAVASSFAVQSTLQAGTAAFGKLVANTGVIIGEVEIGAASTAAGDLAKAAQSAQGATDTGVAMLAVRTDTNPTDKAGVVGDYTPLQVDANGRLYVNIAESSNAITVDAASTSFGAAIEGDVDHDGVDANAPVKIGGRAQDQDAQPDEVADNDRVDALFDRNGYLRVRGDMTPSSADINDALSPDNTIVAAQGAGKRIAVWAWDLISDGTVDARWEDGAGGTAFTGQYPFQAREGIARSAGGLVPLFVGAANTLLNLELSATINVHGSVSFTVVDD